ncbi:radical SAM protein [Aliiglaciecola litoralis]|uniref:Radical SAM protein n=1 Tax=Aliiglaciecola litoralis TaxID=582857 RepID=A0ABN1LID9_9ALTE
MLNSHDHRELLATEAATLVPAVKSFPAVMYLESQRGCPYDCIMCTVPKTYGRRPSEMPDEILDKLNPYFKYVETLAIHGNGEALLSRKMDKYIEIANENGSFLHCNTTGFPLNQRLTNRLVDVKLDLRFSIHAGTAKTYKRVMDNDFEKTIKKIGRLIDLSHQKGHKENTFWLSFIVMKDNVDETEQFINLAYKLGIKEVRFMCLHPNKRTIFGTRRNEKDEKFSHFEQANSTVSARFNKRLPTLKEQAAKLGINIGSGSMNYWSGVNAGLRDVANRFSNKIVKQNIFPISRPRGSCLAPWTGQIQVEQNGDIGLCCSVKHVIGNIYKQSFAEIWHSQHMNEIRDSFSHKKQPRVCGYCRGIGTSEYAIPVNQLIDVKCIEA